MPFTAEELSRIANASLDFYYSPDGLTPLERSRDNLKIARRKLKEAQAQLEKALQYKREVRRLPYAERHRRWLKRDDKIGLAAKFWPAAMETHIEKATT